MALTRAHRRVATTMPSPKRLSSTSFRGRSSIYKERGQAWPEEENAKAEVAVAVAVVVAVLPPHSLSLSISMSSPVVGISSAAPPHSFFPFFPGLFFLSKASLLPNLPSPCQSVCACVCAYVYVYVYVYVSVSVSVSVSGSINLKVKDQENEQSDFLQHKRHFFNL